MITKEQLLDGINVDSNQLRNYLLSIKDDDQKLTRFFVEYVNWNVAFAGGVCLLAGKIASSGLFTDKAEPIAVNNRDNLVASYIFDAARDEFNDHITPYLDTHACLAQAFLLELADSLDMEDELKFVKMNHYGVVEAYNPQHNDSFAIFDSIGFHLGSEILADNEFSIIDNFLREYRPGLVDRLLHTTRHLNGQHHRCYAWIGIHSGGGGAVEQEHFKSALTGANLAVQYFSRSNVETDFCILRLKVGVRNFKYDQQQFFNNLGS